jgi:hypothetical protein
MGCHQVVSAEQAAGIPVSTTGVNSPKDFKRPNLKDDQISDFPNSS